MKRLLLALVLFLLPSIAYAQCNGVFPNNTACGNISGGSNTPRAIPLNSFPANAPGGTTGQIQYNAGSGLFGGFTASQDATINTTTGAVNVTKLQNVPVTTTGASTNDVMYYNDSSWLHNPLLTLFNSVCTLSPSSCAQLLGYINVKWYGAVGDGVTSDTVAFQAAWTAACGGLGNILVPFTTSNYLVGAINGTVCNNVIVYGTGDTSTIKINGGDVDGNWWDLSGSNNIQFKNLKLIDNGSPVAIVFFWACTGTNCGTSGVLSGLSFDHVNINAKHVHAGLFGYGFGCAANCASNISGGSLSISNSTWQNTYNAATLVGAETRNAVLSLSAYNAGSFRSVNQTVTTSTAIAARIHLFNVDVIENSTAAGTLSNNAAIVTDGVNQMIVNGGSFQCNCVADFIGWTSDEGLTFLQTAFQDPVNGSGCATLYWLEFGGGINAAINMTNPFFSCPGSGGAFIALDQGVAAGNGGVWYLSVFGNDIGLNTNNVPFIGKTAAGCGSFTAANEWILESNINLIQGGNNITTCGSIDAHTILLNPGTVTVPSGATDSSHHF